MIMMKQSIKILFIIALLITSFYSTATDNKAEKTSPELLDKITDLTNQAIDTTKSVTKDVLDKSEKIGKKGVTKATDITNKVIDRSKKVYKQGKDAAKKGIDKATEMINEKD